MKKIYALIPALAFSGALLAQIPTTPTGEKISMTEVKNLKHAKMSKIESSRSANTLTWYVDYSASNFDDGSYVWLFNSSYVSTDSSLNYAGVAMAELTGFTDYADISGTQNTYSPYPQIPITIDSIWAYVTHENNSGNWNYFRMKIATLNGSGALTTSSSTLWSQTDSANTTQSPGGNWVGTGAGYLLEYAPNYTTNNGQRVGLVLEYIDPSKQDSFSIQAGYVDDGTGKALQSAFPYSYMRYPPFIPSITKNSNVGYGNPVGSNGWFEAQNWGIWAKITFPDPAIWASVGNVENSVGTLYQNLPNPFNGTTDIRYNLAKESNIALEVHDITGKLVKRVEEGNKAAGKHTLTLDASNLKKGIYFYTLKTDGGSLTRKMVITQ
jgi:hypothetical protein